MSWGVSLPSSRSRRGWRSQIPQMCHSLLSPQKPPDDLEKQRLVNNIACVKHWRWYHRRSQTPPHPPTSPPRATLSFGCILERWKEKLHLLQYGSDAWTVLLRCAGTHCTAGMDPKGRPVLILTRARQDWLVVSSREQGTGLDLSGAGVQVHGGRSRNTRPVFTLYPGAQQIGNAAVDQNANIL